MPKSARILISIGVLVFSTATTGIALAGPSASIEQVRNGPATATSTPTPAWATGNAGASNSHYLESHSTAYRAVLDQLPTDGTVIEMVIGYDVKRSGAYALDYLTHYQRLLPHVLFGHSQPEVFDPLSGISGVGPLVTTAPVPIVSRNVSVDPDGSDPEPAALQPSTNMAALSQPERSMTLFGGTLIDVSYVSEADVSLATSSSETRVKVRFTANSPKAVLAWGGHIACRWDWGFNPDGSPRSAGGISGSSYHMRLVGWNLGSLGNQDRSMSTDAVYPVPRCGVTNVGPFCAGSTNTHGAPAGMESYAWSIADNTSGASIVGSATGPSVVVHSGTTGGSYRVVVTTGASGFTRACEATVTVNAPVTTNGGPDQTVCASSPLVQLAGAVGGGTGSWSGGAGTFSPGRNELNATYVPSVSEVTAGSVTLTLVCTPSSGPCPPASDAMRITINRAATANAGADLVVCISGPQATLAGSVGGAAVGGTWSGGTGTFSPSATALNAVYTPSAEELASGGVTLTLTTDEPDGPCAAVSDQVRITINAAATANAGADLTVCATSPRAQLAGAVGGAAASGIWSGGAGSFSPNASALNAAYTPSAAEMAAGSVTLTLTTNDPAGPCAAVSDQVRIAIDPAATVNAGADLVVCASSPQAQLAGSVGGGASGGTWSGGAGSFSPGAASLNATYTPSAAEIATGSVTLTLTTNDPAGPCGAVNDAMTITINRAAVANAGADRRVCASNSQAQLAGSVAGGATGGIWSGGAGAFSPNSSSLNATYTPTAAEISAGGVTLTLTTNDPAGPCASVSDQMRITIDPITVVNAGPDQTICASSPRVVLAGSVSGTVTSGTWSGGAGTFSAGPSILNATYTATAGEIAAGVVTLTLTSSTPSGPCPAASDQMAIFIQPAATASAGPDQTVCAASPQVQLAGTLGGAAASGTWSGGWGTFSPSETAWNALYTPAASEISAGSVTLTWTTNDPAGPCAAAADQMIIRFDAPTVSVADRVVCTGISPVSLCANPGQGIPPYSYQWSNGAATQCISVSDTGMYTVTITDSKGCRASDNGRFSQRECVGQLTHTSTTCSSFMDGTAGDLPSSDLHYAVRDGVISTISPGVFFYWTKVSAPSDSFVVRIVQTRDNPDFPFLPALQGQVSPYDSNCSRTDSGTETSPGQASVEVTGATAGKVYIVSVKYSLKALVDVPLPPGSGVHYDFRTEINGQIVDADPDGLQIGDLQAPVANTDGSGPGTGGIDNPPGSAAEPGIKLITPRSAMAAAERPSDSFDLHTYRPLPNPFNTRMRMAYTVSRTAATVSIRVVDVAGRVVRTLVSEIRPAGSHVASWDGRDEQGTRMRNGVYFIRVDVGDQARQVRVTMLN
ncbi:MAG: FlgD immunoglobulin-like domain containing protein [Candidatus Eisenbacteria bacterium]